MNMEKKEDPVYKDTEIISERSIEKDTVDEIDPLDDSPIEEVRASVPPTDDPTLPTATFRAWVLGVVFSVAISFSNQV
jgi:hypothetical protein